MKKKMLLICVLSTLLYANGYFMDSYFYTKDAEVNAVAEAGTAQISALGSSLYNPANGVLFGNNTSGELFLSFGSGGYTHDEGGNLLYKTHGRSSKIGFYPERRNDAFGWGVFVAVNKDEFTMAYNTYRDAFPSWSDIIYAKNITIGCQSTRELPLNGDMVLSQSKANTSFSLAVNNIFSFGIGFDLLTVQSTRVIYYDSLLQLETGLDSVQYKAEESRFGVNFGMGLQYRFALDRKVYLEPGFGSFCAADWKA